MHVAMTDQAMSQENVEIVRAIYESWSGGAPPVDFAEVFRSDIEFVNPPEAIDPGTRHGLDGFSAAGQAVWDAFGSLAHEVHELREVGEHVIASVIFRAKGTGSGVAVEQAEFHVWTFRDAKVSRFAWFRSLDQALEAAGDSE
jgi:ketosteroid isomerase-like protein